MTRRAGSVRISHEVSVRRPCRIVHREEYLVRKAERKGGSCILFGGERRVERDCGICRGRNGEDDAIGFDRAGEGLDAKRVPGVIDAGHGRVQTYRDADGMVEDEGPIAGGQRPVVVRRGILIRGPVVQRDLIERRAIGVTGDGFDHRTPWIVCGDESGEWLVGAIQRGERGVMPALIRRSGGPLLVGREMQVVPLDTPIGA